MKIKTASRCVSGLALLILTGTGQAAEQQTQPYVMAVIEENSHGRLVMKGSDEDAIDRLTRKRNVRSLGFADSTSLCVAYTRTRQFDEATVACDAAIKRSTTRKDRFKSKKRGPGAMSFEARADFALASTNRGVLYAVAGDLDAAVAAFESALLANPDLEVAIQNLSRISAN